MRPHRLHPRLPGRALARGAPTQPEMLLDCRRQARPWAGQALCAPRRRPCALPCSASTPQRGPQSALGSRTRFRSPTCAGSASTPSTARRCTLWENWPAREPTCARSRHRGPCALGRQLASRRGRTGKSRPTRRATSSCRCSAPNPSPQEADRTPAPHAPSSGTGRHASKSRQRHAVLNGGATLAHAAGACRHRSTGSPSCLPPIAAAAQGRPATLFGGRRGSRPCGRSWGS
mmetsp:Transcript_6693/g.27464  ORF Transcript_6693/g.27464 Transcript_6693/m.27464 type:complete len:232 (+) Transcript_6693:81-776(+)